ncbi:MAG: putative dehydrogenase [Flavobacteriales bacterium]|jgi:predicted dehydrogenase
MIHWGILGCGHIAAKFAADLLLTEGGSLYGVGSRSSEKATEFAATFQATTAYGSYAELIQDPVIDIIYIATPHSFHKEHTLRCLAHKKAVLCEKPFAMNLEEAEEMIAFAKAQQTFLMEALWTYFLPHFSFVLDQIASGSLGKVTHLKADFGFEAAYAPNGRLFNKKLGGGSLLDVGIYPIFTALSLLGPTDQIEARATFGPTGVDHHCYMRLQYPNAVIASLESSIDRKTATECHILLEHGEIHIQSRFHEPTSVTILANDVLSIHEFPTLGHGYHYEILHCQEMLVEGRIESTQMPFAKSKQLLQMLDKIRQVIGLKYD